MRVINTAVATVLILPPDPGCCVGGIQRAFQLIGTDLLAQVFQTELGGAVFTPAVLAQGLEYLRNAMLLLIVFCP